MERRRKMDARSVLCQNAPYDCSDNASEGGARWESSERQWPCSGWRESVSEDSKLDKNKNCQLFKMSLEMSRTDWGRYNGRRAYPLDSTNDVETNDICRRQDNLSETRIGLRAYATNHVETNMRE